MLSNKNLLIVEDDSMSRVIYRMILEKYGATLTFVSNAEVAHHKFASDAWDLIILDLAYDNNGFALFQQIRETSCYELTPIVGVSTYDASVMMPKAEKLGFNGFIAKPINHHFFAHQIAEILSGVAVWNSLDFVQ